MAGVRLSAPRQFMDDFNKYLDKAFKFLSYRPRSEKELRDRLKLKKAPVDIIERIVKSLKEQNFLNDRDFACWFIEQRTRFAPKAWRMIELELRSKGIDKELIEELRIKKHELRGSEEIDIAMKIVERKIDKYKNLDKQEVYMRLGGYLARRGFDWYTIKKAIDSTLGKKV